MNKQVSYRADLKLREQNQHRSKPRTTKVKACPLCNEQISRELFRMSDRLHETPGEFTYRRCMSCMTVFQDPRVVAEDLSLCYPSQYYTHKPHKVTFSETSNLLSQFHTAPKRGLRGIRNKVREAIISEVQGNSLPGFWGRLGKVLAIIPRLRIRAFYGLVEDDFLPRTPNYPKALDIGCGAGQRMLNLAKVWNVDGVEWDPIAAEIARQTTGSTIWQGDFRNLPLPLENYGLIFLHHVFEHLDDPVIALQRIKDLLAPGGRVVLVYPNPNALGAKIYGDAWYPWEIPRHLVLPSLSAMEKAAKKLGFTFIRGVTTNNYAAEYFALSRGYKLGEHIDEFHPDVKFEDRVLNFIEYILLVMRMKIGEEITIVLQK